MNQQTKSSSKSRPVQLETQLQKLILREVFTQFIKAAERKLSELDHDALDREKDLSTSILPGADPVFDSKIANLAEITSHCPKLMIDSIMIWRGQRRNQAAEMLAEIQTSKYPNVSVSDLENRIKRRISLMANFILCRVLIAIIQNLGTKPLNSELGKRLEDMVFGQLRSADPEQTARFVNLEANVKLFSKLMGTLSNIRFDTISDRFIQELRDIKLTDKSAELKLELMIKCMHYLKLKIYPMSALEESADFLEAINELFADSASTRIKSALGELFNQLLQPVARIADAELNVPVWQKTIENISPKVLKMLSKGKMVHVALPLMTTLLTVSKKEYFLKNWPSLIEILIGKCKEKSFKNLGLLSICKLLWTYLFRCSESPSSLVQKRLEYFIKTFFAPKKSIFPSECNADIFVRICYYMLVKYPEYANENVLLHILKSDLPQYGETKSDGSIFLEEVPNADRLFIVVRSFLLILRDVQQSIASDKKTGGVTAGAVSAVQSKSGFVLVEGKINLHPPDFPDFQVESDGSIEFLVGLGSRELQSSRQRHHGVDRDWPINNPLPKSTQLRMGSSMMDTLKIVNFHVGQTLMSLDNVLAKNMVVEPVYFTMANNSYMGTINNSGSFKALNGPGSFSTKSQQGNSYLSSNRNSVKGQTTSATGMSKIGSVNGNRRASAVVDTLNSFTGIPSRPGGGGDNQSSPSLEKSSGDSPHYIYVRLLRTLFDSFPRLYPTGLVSSTVVEWISVYSIMHYNPDIRDSAFHALCRIAKVRRVDPNGTEWDLRRDNELASASVFRVFNESSSRAIKTHFTNLWSVNERFEEVIMNVAIQKLRLLEIWLEDISTDVTYTPKEQDVEKVVELIESQGLFYLCCMNSIIRKTALAILEKSREFRCELIAKLPHQTQKQKTAQKHADSVDRLSILHNRRSLYQKKRASGPMDEKIAVSIYDIIIDQGSRLVNENYHDSIVSDSDLPLKKQVLGHQAKLMAMENVLLYVAQSSEALDISVWNRCFTALLKSLVAYGAAGTLKIVMSQIWEFLQVMQPIIHSVSEEFYIFKSGFLPSLKTFEKMDISGSDESVNKFISYWKSYTSVAYICIDFSFSDSTTTAPDSVLFTPSELNRNVFPLISSGKHEVRRAAVLAIGCVQSAGYSHILRDIQPYLSAIIHYSQMNMRKQGSFEAAFDRTVTQLTCLLTYIIKANFVRDNQSIMLTIQDYIRAMVRYFNEPDVQSEWKHQITRYYFCCFIEKYYRFLVKELKDKRQGEMDTFLNFSLRNDLFSLFESWCGFGVDGAKSRLWEANMVAQYLDSNLTATDNSKLEAHRNSVQIASLKAMASLCQGSLTSTTDPLQNLDLPRIILWINSLLEATQLRFHLIARTAVENVLDGNLSNDYLMSEIFNNCYSTNNVTTGYFLALVGVLSKLRAKRDTLSKLAKPKLILLILFHLGNSSITLRKASRYLMTLLDRYLLGNTSNQEKDDDEDIIDLFYSYNDQTEEKDIADIESIHQLEEVDTADFIATSYSTSTPLSYIGEQRDTSIRFSNLNPEISFEILNEITSRIQMIKKLNEEDQQNYLKSFLTILTPWLSNLQIATSAFKLDSMKELKPQDQAKWSILYNLFYITSKYSALESPEIESIWVSLASPSRKEQNIPFYLQQKSSKSKICTIIDFLALNAFALQSNRALFVSKNITMFLAKSQFGACLIEYIISKLDPYSIVPLTDDVLEQLITSGNIVSKVTVDSLNSSTKNVSRFSLCYLYLMQLVDVTLVMDHYVFILYLPNLLHIIFTQLDSKSSRYHDILTLLNFLIQSMFSKDKTKRQRIELILTALNVKDERTIWKYEDPTPETPDIESVGQLSALVLEILDLFSTVCPMLKQDWAELAVYWGSVCPDTHVACRSLQIFRAINHEISDRMLSQLVNGLSVSVSNDQVSSQSHSLDLLLSLHHVVCQLGSDSLLHEYPHLFWVALSLMSSVHEWEYKEGLKMLCLILGEVDIKQVSVINSLMSAIPSKWPGGFAGLLIPLSRGLSSSKTANMSLEIIEMVLESSVAVFLDTRPSKYLFVTLSFLPKILQPYGYESGMSDLFDRSHSVIEASLQKAESLSGVCQQGQNQSLAHLLLSFSNQRIRKRADFLQQLVVIIKEEFRDSEGQVVKFCLSLLPNTDPLYPQCFLSLLELLWLDQSPCPNSIALPTDITGLWLRPLICLLDTSFALQSAHLLDVMLSGRLKASESEISSNVGGAQNIYAYVRRSKSDSFVFLASGWFMESFKGDGCVLTKKRLSTVGKSFGSSFIAHQVDGQEMSQGVDLDIVTPTKKTLILEKLSAFEKHYRKLSILR